MRQDALSIELRTSGKDKLAEEYGKVIANIQAMTLASVLKNTDLSGDPTSGSVEAKRFVNAVGQAYGTARAGGAGNKVKAEPVTIKINDDVEYIEEVEEKDLKLYGVSGLIEKRTANHQSMFAVDLDTKFFATAKTEGTALTLTATTPEEQLEEAILTLQNTKNDFVKGVPRNMINVVASDTFYSKLRLKLATIVNPNASIANYEGGVYNNVRVYSSAFLPTGTDFIVMVNGAVAQPVMTSIANPEKIQFSDATGFGLFTYKGTEAVMPDLIFVKNAA